MESACNPSIQEAKAGQVFKDKLGYILFHKIKGWDRTLA
jgi:hypothetical protein